MKYIHFIIGIALFIGVRLFEVSAFDTSALGLALWMVYWWIVQPVPLYVTALLPIAVGVPFELIPNDVLAQSYGNQMIFLFLGGFILALGIEKWKLHEQIAFSILRLFGRTPKRILGGFMFSTALLSMWISNTATTLMMLPIAMSVIQAIPSFKEKRLFSVGLLLSIAFSANIGGTATLIGTPPNIQMAGILEQEFNLSISFFEWFMIGTPFMIIMMVLTYITVKFYFIKNASFKMDKIEPQKLDPNQKRVLYLFLTVVALWMSRTFLNDYMPIVINDTVIALSGAILLFIFPSTEKRPLLLWDDLDKLPWGILFLFGGGMALAAILAEANIVSFLVDVMKPLANFPVIILLLVIFTVALFATELMSNLALVSLLIPLIGKFAIELDLPLLGISAGVALSASCAFMLPVATPPNAIIYSSNLIQIKDMVRYGFLLNLIASVVVTGVIYVLFFI
ncbi:DASS family sodium-coupled anion symporter [Brumimicrobium glaciale]|uniref:DASS family sodium-coupled anion symporter n=1 Tax=Brumimicrobium glaciale TaxID=200475 RepID=A0A4Q4KJL4_9FLAO|nr:DASS family sodium-coupled anion symporter [Brumimicrobium glaciale]RYM33385.1 DASS family sodium-coupled anion symporter [Brumimicrobium glaciale]